MKILYRYQLADHHGSRIKVDGAAEPIERSCWLSDSLIWGHVFSSCLGTFNDACYYNRIDGPFTLYQTNYIQMLISISSKAIHSYKERKNLLIHSERTRGHHLLLIVSFLSSSLIARLKDVVLISLLCVSLLNDW